MKILFILINIFRYYSFLFFACVCMHGVHVCIRCVWEREREQEREGGIYEECQVWRGERERGIYGECQVPSITLHPVPLRLGPSLNLELVWRLVPLILLSLSIEVSGTHTTSFFFLVCILGGLNSGPYACEASTLTYWAISPAPSNTFWNIIMLNYIIECFIQDSPVPVDLRKPVRLSPHT